MVTFNSVSIGNKAYLIIVTWNCTIFVAFIKQVSNLIDPSQPPPPWAYCFVVGGPQRMLLLFKILNEQKKGEWCENKCNFMKKKAHFQVEYGSFEFDSFFYILLCPTLYLCSLLYLLFDERAWTHKAQNCLSVSSHETFPFSLVRTITGDL